MAPDAECGHGEGHLHGLFSGGGLCHECSAGKHLGSVKLEDGAIDSGGKTKVVGIHDEARHEN